MSPCTAGLYGLPLAIVQSIVGHMTPELLKIPSKSDTAKHKIFIFYLQDLSFYSPSTVCGV